MVNFALDDESLVWLFNYWSAIRGDRLMPSRTDIDPTQIPGDTLRWLIIADIITDADIPGGFAFRYRLMSAHHVEITGRELTGSYVHEVTKNAAYNDYVVALYHKVMQEKRPLYTENYWQYNGLVTRRNKRLMMPLSDNDHDVNMVFSGQVLAYGDKGKYTQKIDDQDFGETLRAVL